MVPGDSSGSGFRPEQHGDDLVRKALRIPSGGRAAPGQTPAKSGRKGPARVTGSGKVLQLKVSLKGARPPIWRRLEVPDDVMLEELHEILQVAFEWGGGHLHVFEGGGRAYADPSEEVEDTSSEVGVRLTRVVPVGGRLSYTYDFGDDWVHMIEVEKRTPALDGVSYPRCTGGRRTAPPDDCGGIWGYQNLLEMHADPEFVADEDSREEWLLSFMPADFDPSAFDPAALNRRLAAELSQ